MGTLLILPPRVSYLFLRMPVSTLVNFEVLSNKALVPLDFTEADFTHIKFQKPP